MIPLFVDCSGRRIVIFGGGEVASRKAAYFSREADVLVASRSFSPKISILPVRQALIDIKKASDDEILTLITHAFLVIGTLPDPALNNRIGDICRKQQILFNNAEGEPGDVIIPSVTGGDNFHWLSVPKGSSPASFPVHQGAAWSCCILLSMRWWLCSEKCACSLKQYVSSPAKRNAILREILHDRTVWEALRKHPEEVRQQLKEVPS